MKELLNSKRFWVTLLGTIAATAAGMAGQPWWVCLSIIAGAVSYAISQGMADHGKVAQEIAEDAATKRPVDTAVSDALGRVAASGEATHALLGRIVSKGDPDA